MPSLCVFGAQWGDEGKGKIIDRLSRNADLVVRYQGGANAGHTVIVGGEKYVLHLVPSGVLRPGTLNVIGNGVAVDPLTLLEEIDALTDRGVSVTPENFLLSSSAHVIFDFHRRLDALAERWRGDGRIGTTGRGIGPAYADKAARLGLRIGDLVSERRLRGRLTACVGEKNAQLERIHGEAPIDLEAAVARYRALGDRIAPFIGDAGAAIRDAYAAGRSVLFEGAQGAMLDLDHGTYPFVTSSNTGVAGVGVGTGFPPQKIERVIGIAKAYCTRVGEGPFPSELTGPLEQRLRDEGNEYGATTGRPRRCGWFDAVQVRHAVAVNGADGLVVTNLDVLDGFDEIEVVTSYRHTDFAGGSTETYPTGFAAWNELEVQSEARAGWKAPLTACRTWEELPAAAQGYVQWLEALVGVPIVMLSVGPERDQVIPRGLE
ncbi:MAG: adenylosuccinate synthase [Planctomycetota bacterium]